MGGVFSRQDETKLLAGETSSEESESDTTPSYAHSDQYESATSSLHDEVSETVEVAPIINLTTPTSPAHSGSDQYTTSLLQEVEVGGNIEATPTTNMTTPTSVSTSLPSTIDSTVAINAFRSQHNHLLNLIRHCLPSLASSLYAEFMIPEGIYKKACNESLDSNETSVALLDCIKSRLEAKPSDFVKLVDILNSKPFLRSQTEELVKSYCAFSNAPTSNCPPATSSAISHYRTYLKHVYKNSPTSPDAKWPPSPGREFINLEVVDGGSCRDDYIGHTLQGNVKQVLKSRREISIKQILKPVKGQDRLRLVLMEGAPGIGKSTLAWELCRKWEELSCMQQYSLIVLLRLREEKVQKISEVSQLFISYESRHKKCLLEEVLESQGSGVLFILDGFDELPKALQNGSFLLDLIKGCVLPASTVLVTSRPSATAELLTSCSPKHIEILGFTQESVEEYASSIFSEPEELRKFMDYISVSENPAINSLMYIPLNAAIIVRIYHDFKSDALLPHTLTELYTLLCLTILNRDLEIRVEKFDELPADLHKQILHLSLIAFEGIFNDEIIFHTLPPGLVHFGFLDAVSALYGGGRVSYNFLHLTLQEFFAAYHISHLGSSGLEVFKQHSKDRRWNVVWRFVAGLTKFAHYESHMDSDSFIWTGEDSETRINIFTIQCLFEAQSMDHFSSIFTSMTTRVDSWSSTALDTYALGFCISNFHTGVSWGVEIFSSPLTPFICGLGRKTPSAGVISQLGLHSCEVNFSELKKHLSHHNTSLCLSTCGLTNDDLIHLSKLIPHMTSLRKLNISFNDVTDGDQDGLLKTLQQLPNSNVTTLNIIATGFCRLLRDSPHDYYSALKQLVCSPSGKLEKLGVGDRSDVDDGGRLASLLSAPFSLKTLELFNTNISGHTPYLKNNTCLTKFSLEVLEHIKDPDWSGQAPHIVQILEHNKTLKHLVLSEFTIDTDIDAVRIIVSALPGNNTLQSIELHIHIPTYRASSYMKTHHEELTLDPRISYYEKNAQKYFLNSCI